jgi:anthranilate phosphoribosyltransferase
MLKELTEKLLQRSSLSEQESMRAVQEMVEKQNVAQIAAFLCLLRAKGESVEELFGVILAMRQRMLPLEVRGKLLDIVGTGGDGAHTVNISTGSSILAASCGVKIAKHGNRSVSSRCGSADVLEALGVSIEMPPEKLARCIEEVGIGFFFAPNFHPAMLLLKEVRQQLGMRTIFNLIGPLLNPAGAEHLMVGVCSAELVEKMASVLQRLGTRRSLVFHGCGLDELSCVGPAEAILIDERGMERLVLDPKKLGLSPCLKEHLKGGDASFNAALLERALSGERGPIQETLIFNAAVALYLYGVVDSIEEGIARARIAIKEKAPLQLLLQWRRYG